MSRKLPAKWIRDMLPKKCVNCGSTTGIVYHHIVPVELGGNEVPSNIAVLCSVCHGKVHYGKDGVMDHGQLVRHGIHRAMEHGVRVGRPPADGEHIMRVIAEQSTQFNKDSLITEAEIREKLGIKNVCYCKYKRKLKEAMNADVWPYAWEKPVQVRDMPIYEHKLKRLRGDAI